MPDPVTHSVFGQQVMAQLPEDIREAVGASKNVTITNYITVDGAEDPEDFVERFVRSLELQMRTA